MHKERFYRQFNGELWLALRDREAMQTTGYCRGVLRSLRRAHKRSERRRLHRERAWAAIQDEVLSPLELLQRRQLIDALRDALDRLAPHERALVEARYGHDRPAKELAAARSEPANTVRWRLKQALHRLRILLTPVHELALQPDETVSALIQTVEARLEPRLTNPINPKEAWSGRLVVHLHPSAAGTTVTQIELVPPAPRRLQAGILASLQSPMLPGCDRPPFEMHFDVADC